LFSLNNLLKSKGAKLRILVAPNKEQVYPEYMPSINIINSYKREQIIRDHFKNTEIIFMYPLEEMLDAKLYGTLYFKQDTHWNYYGAYVGYKTFMSSIGREASNARFEDAEFSGGDLSKISSITSTYDTYDTFYKNIVMSGSSSLNDLDSLFDYSKNENEQGKLILIGDSYRMMMKYYAFSDFGEVRIHHANEIDSALFEESLDSINEGDVILITVVERYDSLIESIANKILEFFG